MIGRALNGRYELVEVIGVGGMATVWRGVDHVLGRQVAVKVLNGGLADDPRFADRFSREAQHAAMLVHPRIVMVFDSGVDQGSPYIVMELVQGRSLAALLAHQPVLPVERAVGVAAAVCEALEVAHGAGLVHRDIKPGNIMITDDGGVKVVDFGIARAGSSENLTQTAMVVGTAAYLSPEQATAAPLDGRTDLYAAGCVLYEMLAGTQPFTAETPVAIAFKHVSEQPLPPSAHRPGLPPAVDAAVLRLLAKNPADRPPTAAHARAELLAAVPGSADRDRTGELLAAAGAPTQALPPVTAPFVEPQRTSLLPPPPAAAPAGPHRDAGPGDRRAAREGRRSPLLLGALGLAGVAGAAVLALTAFDDGPADAAAPRPAAATGAPAAATTAPQPTATTPVPTATGATPTPSPPRGQSPAAAITAFRQTVAQTPVAKDEERHAELVRMLGEAVDRLRDDQSEAAERELRNAQRVVKELAKKHAVDGPTSQAWQARLGSLITAVERADRSGGDND